MNTKDLLILKKKMLKVLENTSINSLFDDAGFDMYTDESKNEYSDKLHPLMYDFEKNELFFLGYCIPDDGWVKIAQEQNPWIFICYLSAQDINLGPDEYIEERIKMIE